MADSIPYVSVAWLDAWQDTENFSTIHGIMSTHSPMPVETRGWILVDDDVGISLASERSTQDGHDVYRGRTFVPRAMIQSVTVLHVAKPRKRRAAQKNTPPTENTEVDTQKA